MSVEKVLKLICNQIRKRGRKNSIHIEFFYQTLSCAATKPEYIILVCFCGRSCVNVNCTYPLLGNFRNIINKYFKKVRIVLCGRMGINTIT